VFSEDGALYARHEQIVAAVKAVFQNDGGHSPRGE
jgi:hypothetical protein